MTTFTYRTDLSSVDWDEMKATLAADGFDNGRTPAELAESFGNSTLCVLAYAEEAAGRRLIGTVRCLSDGVCNAYIVDMWMLSAYRGQGVATTMMEMLLAQLDGQHVYLFTDTAEGFYEKLGFKAQPVGMGKVVGLWLKRFPPREDG
jgi:ribosomal protein S18 acetylase RimI-like enzyme